MAVVNSVIDKEALVIKVVDKVVVIEDKEDTAYLKEITSITPITLVNKI